VTERLLQQELPLESSTTQECNGEDKTTNLRTEEATSTLPPPKHHPPAHCLTPPLTLSTTNIQHEPQDRAEIHEAPRASDAQTLNHPRNSQKMRNTMSTCHSKWVKKMGIQ
jgi:hypothetical protein